MEIELDEKIQKNLLQVHTNIDRAAVLADRNPENIRLLIVTKKQPVEKILSAITAGARLFGENYADEAVPKMLSIASREPLEWHMIGHVQSRKAKTVSRFFHMVESVDSVKIAERLDKICFGLNRILQVLLEINVGGEESKSGWRFEPNADWDSLVPQISKVATLANLKINGLMTMPPLFDDPENTRPYFRQLVKVQAYLKDKLPGVSWDELSMGTSQDYEVAVQEGATILRIGQAVLGPRPK